MGGAAFSFQARAWQVGRERLHAPGKKRFGYIFDANAALPAKAAGSFLGEERDCLFSGIEFPAAALRERQVSSRTASPMACCWRRDVPCLSP